MKLRCIVKSLKVLSLCAGGFILCSTAQSHLQVDPSTMMACEYVLTTESFNQMKASVELYNQLTSSIDALNGAIGTSSLTEENIPENIRGLMTQRDQLSFRFELKPDLRDLEELVLNQYRRVCKRITDESLLKRIKSLFPVENEQNVEWWTWDARTYITSLIEQGLLASDKGQEFLSTLPTEKTLKDTEAQKNRFFELFKKFSADISFVTSSEARNQSFRKEFLELVEDNASQPLVQEKLLMYMALCSSSPTPCEQVTRLLKYNRDKVNNPQINKDYDKNVNINEFVFRFAQPFVPEIDEEEFAACGNRDLGFSFSLRTERPGFYGSLIRKRIAEIVLHEIGHILQNSLMPKEWKDSPLTDLTFESFNSFATVHTDTEKFNALPGKIRACWDLLMDVLDGQEPNDEQIAALATVDDSAVTKHPWLKENTQIDPQKTSRFLVHKFNEIENMAGILLLFSSLMQKSIGFFNPYSDILHDEIMAPSHFGWIPEFGDFDGNPFCWLIIEPTKALDGSTRYEQLRVILQELHRLGMTARS